MGVDLQDGADVEVFVRVEAVPFAQSRILDPVLEQKAAGVTAYGRSKKKN